MPAVIHGADIGNSDKLHGISLYLDICLDF
jgi:hypothetical protein